MDQKIYKQLLKLTKKALRKSEIAVAAVIVKNNKIIASAYNKRQKQCDVTGHAEIIAIRKAEKKIRDWRLDGYDMYVTLKPCKMCEIIINESRIEQCFYLIDKPEEKQTQMETKICYLQTKETDKIYNLFKKSFKKLR